jgi:PKD domain
MSACHADDSDSNSDLGVLIFKVIFCIVVFIIDSRSGINQMPYQVSCCNIQSVVFMESYKPDAQRIIGIGRLHMVSGQNVRIFQVLAVVLIGCSLMAGTVSAGVFSQFLSGATGCCSDPCCEQNQSLCVFGGPCSERVTMVTLGMSGASFSGAPTSGASPLLVQFSAITGPEITSWSWDFGDGSFGSGMNPVHTYTAPGTYTVKLTVRQGQANVNYQTSAYFSWGLESTWQKEAMIQVTGPVATGNLVSSGQEGVVIPVAGLAQADNGEQPDLIAHYKSGMYHAGTLWKAQPLTYQRGKISPRATGLASWKTGVV